MGSIREEEILCLLENQRYDMYRYCPKPRYYWMPEIFFHFGISPVAADVLAYLVFRVRKKVEHKDADFIKNNYWFVVQSKLIEEKFNYSKRIQVRGIKELVQAGFILTQMRGFPKRRRWLTVRTEKIYEKEVEVRLNGYL